MQLLKATVVAFALLALATTVAAQNEYQKLTVELPLAIKGEYDERPAMFGVPPYGGSVAGRLIYTPAVGFDGCSAMNLTQWRRNVNEVLIVAVDRGPCSFVSMVRNAQRAGAQAVVVFDTRDEFFLPYMADDGTGSDVTKPSVLLRKDSSDLLRPHATGFDSNVVVTLAWDLPNPDGRVEWDFWSSVADPFSASFKRDMAIISKSLGERALVNALPLIATYEYSYCRLAPDLCGELCMNKGRYCAADPDRNTATGNSGRDVVLEDARQRCVWQHFNNTGNQQGFWQYLALFEERCITTSASGRSWPNDCWRTIISDRSVNMPESAMTACFAGANALSPDNDNDSPMLEEIIELRDLENVVKMPMIYVNSAPYLGRIECTSGQPLNTQSCPVLQTICQGFVDRSVVPSCEANVCGIGNVVDKCGVCNGDGSTCKKPRSTGGVVIVLVLIFAVLLLCGVVWYVKRRERAMAHNLDSILRSYMPVDESGRLAHTRVPLTSDGAHDVAQSGERDETEDDDRALI